MADTLANISLVVAFTAVMTAAILFMVKSVTDLNRKADATMEFHNIHHARHMTSYGNELDAVIRYIIPKERNLWDKIRGHVSVWAWECDFHRDDLRVCKFYVSISTSSYFYMQLKGWTETSDKELAQKAMDYMKWEREIP